VAASTDTVKQAGSSGGGSGCSYGSTTMSSVISVNECDPAAGECSGGRWGRIGRRSELVKSSSPAHARTRGNQVGGVLRLLSELLPDDSLTGHVLSTMVDISARWWLSHDDRRDQILPTMVGTFGAMVAADRMSTKRPNFVFNWTQIRSVVDAYSAARWSLRCSVVIEAMDPI
jgi:hypothetical protein